MLAGLAENYIYIAAALICLVVLAIGLAFGDVQRFRFRRVRAIAGVCFAESIRRKVLWITPLAIIGVIAVTQFTKAADEQDAIRQMAKYCLFATSLIVIIAALILACTNLPREIENRVIYTVVTKPTTRLEIVLGKVLGLRRVSAADHRDHGACSRTGTSTSRPQSGVSRIQAALESGQADRGQQPDARALRRDRPARDQVAGACRSDLEIFSRPPDPDGTKWMGGGRQQYYVVRLRLTRGGDAGGRSTCCRRATGFSCPPG